MAQPYSADRPCDGLWARWSGRQPRRTGDFVDVSTRVTIKLDTAVRASLALGLAIAVNAVVDASEIPIYKCIQAAGGVLYTDSLCRGGELLDIQSSAPDPAAIKRLERAQAALDTSAARRTADAEIEAARREELERLLREEEAARRAAAAAFTYANSSYAPWWGWFPLFVHPRFHRPRPPELPMQPRFAPNPPFIVPRH
jgi:hypothetical protein